MRLARSWHRTVRGIGVSAVVLLVFLEISIRAVTNTLFVFDVEVRDPLVGGIPKPGVSIRHPTKWYRMTAVENGTRWNGSGSIAGEAAFALAVGDSFTFGADVSDEETWPAALERETGRRVVNAGVAGFGLDQTVLRAEQLVGMYRPEFVIVSFIADDIGRTEWARQVGSKPYFVIDEQGNLEFHAMPVVERSILQRILAVSIVTHSLFQRFVDEEGPQFVRVHNRGREVACLLMGRLRALGVSNSTRILVVGQPQVPDETPENLETNHGILECAKRNNLDALNLCLVLQALPDAARRDLYFPNHGHMTPAGNALVAKEIARVLR